MHDQSIAGRRGLTALFAVVVTARETERTQRHLASTVANSTALAHARASTLRALLAYADAIEALNWPVPRTILADIQMHQGMCVHRITG